MVSDVVAWLNTTLAIKFRQKSAPKHVNWAQRFKGNWLEYVIGFDIYSYFADLRAAAPSAIIIIIIIIIIMHSRPLKTTLLCDLL